MTFISLFNLFFAPAGRLIAALCDPGRRERTVIVVLVAYVAIWTLYGVLAKGSQDVHTDMAEVVGWSRELALGYAKHPPLSAWLAAGWFALLPVADWSFYLLAMTVAGVALWIAWRLAADYLAAEARVLALAMLMLVPFFNFHALKFNANTVLMPLWAATALCFLRSYERRSAGWAALAGLFAAGAMLGKYWSIFLLVGLGLAALLDSRRAAYFRSSAPWITVAVGVVALTPNVVWLIASDFAPIKYANFVHATAAGGVAFTGMHYLEGSVAYAVIPVLLACAVMRPRPAALSDILQPKTPPRRLAAAAFWWPFLLPLLAPILADFNITSLWSMSAWALFPVVVLSSPLVVFHRDAMWTMVAIAMILPLIMVAAAPVIAGANFRDSNNSGSFHYRLLAERTAVEWRRVTDKPLLIVAGEEDLAYGAAFYLPDRPSIYPNLIIEDAPRVVQERLRRDGFVIVCRPSLQCRKHAAQHGFEGAPIEIEITRTFGTASRSGRYTIIIVPPAARVTAAQ